ncbi:MAG: hypothetical protein ACLPID_03980 [Beijerinckiaceae bacterium]
MLTSGSMHDSQVAMPLVTMIGACVFCLYDRMDAALMPGPSAIEAGRSGKLR